MLGMLLQCLRCSKVTLLAGTDLFHDLVSRVYYSIVLRPLLMQLSLDLFFFEGMRFS